MHLKTTARALVAARIVAAQGRPSDESICDYYTKKLLGNNTAENQYLHMTLAVNTVVIDTQPNLGVVVPGILAKVEYNSYEVNLLPYFTGGFDTTNRDGKAVSVNFLDGGGAAPLMKNLPADDTSSNQYFLLTHLYQFFGSLLGCSQYSMPGFPAYTGKASMYKVHRFMNLNPWEVGYFNEQVILAAKSFGVEEADLEVIAKALDGLFGHRCAPPATVVAEQGPRLQSICVDKTCPLAENADCKEYKDKEEAKGCDDKNEKECDDRKGYDEKKGCDEEKECDNKRECDDCKDSKF